MRRAALLGCLAGLLAAASPDAAKFTIGGVLIQEPAKQPIKHALVTIAQNDHPERSASLFTAADGRFTFTDVPAGKYTLQAKVRGERKNFEEDGPYSTGIVTGPGLDSEHLIFPFRLPATLRIKVEDEEGDPAFGVQVMLFAKRVVAGWPQTAIVSQSVVDNDGLARLTHLTPGTYFVAVAGTPWYAQFQDRRQGANAESAALGVAYPLTYYPAAQNPEGATPIVLRAGQTAELQMSLRAVPAMKIFIDGSAGPEGARGGRETAGLEATGPGGVPFQLPVSLFQADSGRLEISGVAPGNYVLAVSARNPHQRGLQALGTAHINGGTEVRVNTAELPRTTVSGRLTLDGSISPAGVTIFLAQPANGQNAFCRVAPDDTFTCAEGRGLGGNITPGLYQIRLGDKNDLYLKSASAQGASFANGLLDVREGTAVALHLEAAKGRMKLTGMALRDGKPVSGAMILLISRDGASGWEVPRDQSDSDGTFTLLSVHPGSYYLVALDHGRDLEYHSPQVIAPYLRGATRLDIPLAREQRLEVNVQSRLP